MEAGRLRIRTVEKLSLEDYVRFIGSNQQYDLTNGLLAQVIHMHGFKKGKKTKNILTEGVNSIELMDLTRSTLKDNDMSSNAFISMDEAIKDLVELNWKECCVTSNQIINSSNYNRPDLVGHNELTAATSSSSVLVKRKRKRRVKKLEAIQGAIEGGDGEGAGSAESACCSGGVDAGVHIAGTKTLVCFSEHPSLV